MNLPLLNNIRLGRTKVGNLYVKHHTLEDEARLQLLTESFLALAKKRKVKTESEALASADKDGTWKVSDEAALKEAVMYCGRLQESYDKVIGPQKKYLEEDLLKQVEKVISMRQKRFVALGSTAEQVSSRMAQERFIVSLFYKDSDMSIRAVLPEEIEYISDTELEFYLEEYSKYRKESEDSAIKKLACSSYCQNLYFISGGPSNFFGKTVLELTVQQQNLLMNLENYKNIIQNLVGKVSPENLADHEFLDKWGASSEKGREHIENSNKPGANSNNTGYDSIRRAAQTESKGVEQHVQTMKSVL